MSNYGWGEWADRKVGVWYITVKGRQAFTLLRSLVHDDEDNGPIW